uniref:Uncharacterized protein n=1 Tax=Spermophilus dauricus TaxID=99837 RepID=A0A8C9PI96_SPEDA
MQQQTTVLSTSGSYLSPGVAFSPCHIQQIGAVSLNGLPATPIAPASGLHSPPLLGTAAVPGLVAPITNGFAGVVPFPGGHPALETVYANGLVPYPGNSGWSPEAQWNKHESTPPGAQGAEGRTKESQQSRWELWSQEGRPGRWEQRK